MYLMFHGFVFSFFLVLISAGMLGGSAAPTWTVIGTVGKWSLQRADSKNQTIVSIGTQVNQGDILSRSSPPPSKTGSITLFDGVGHRTIACDDPNSLPDRSKEGCVSPVLVHLDPASEEAKVDGPVTILLAAVQKLFTEEPTTYYKAVSRDYSGLEDSVLAAQSGSVILTPLFTALSKGSYKLSFVPFHEANTTRQGVDFVNVSWDPETKDPPAEMKLAPGLYVVSANTLSGDPAGQAWVLVASASQAQRKSEAFGKVKALTDSWREDSPAASIKAINRAALDSLSRQP